MKGKIRKIGKKSLAMLVTMALIASLAVMMVTPAVAAEPGTPQAQYEDYVARMEAAIDAAPFLASSQTQYDFGNGYLLDLQGELGSFLANLVVETFVENIMIDLGVAAALAGIDADGNVMDKPVFDDPRFSPVQNSNTSTGYTQDNFDQLISRSGGRYEAAVRYLTQGGIREGQRGGALAYSVQWFFSFKSMLNPAYQAAATSGILGSISESGLLPAGTTLADIAEVALLATAKKLEAKVNELVSYAADAEALASHLLLHLPDCDDALCDDWTHMLSVSVDDYILAVNTYISFIETDLIIIGDLATGAINSEEWTENINGATAYNTKYAPTTLAKLNAALSFLENGGYHDDTVSAVLAIPPWRVDNSLTYKSSFTSYDATFEITSLFRYVITNTASVMPIASNMLELLRVGATPQFPELTPLQQARFEYNQSLKRLQQIKDDPSGIVAAVLSESDDLAPLLDDLNTLVGSLDDIIAIVNLISSFEGAQGLLDPILGQFGLSFSMLEAIAGLGELLSELNFIDTSGNTDLMDQLNDIIGPIVGVAIDFAIGAAEVVIEGAKLASLVGWVDMIDAYNTAQAGLDLAYNGLTESAAEVINGIFEAKIPNTDISIRDILEFIHPFIDMIGSGISLVNDVMLIYKQVTDLLTDFSIGNLADTTYTLADISDDLAVLVKALGSPQFSEMLSGLFGDGGVGNGIIGGITNGLAGLLGIWLDDNIGTDLGLGDADLGIINDTINGLAGGLLGNLSGLGDLLHATATILRRAAKIGTDLQNVIDGDWMALLNLVIDEGRDLIDGTLFTDYGKFFSALIALFTGSSSTSGSPTGGALAVVAQPLDIPLAGAPGGWFDFQMVSASSFFAGIESKLGSHKILPSTFGLSGTALLSPLECAWINGLIDMMKSCLHDLTLPNCKHLDRINAFKAEFISYISGMKDCLDKMKDMLACVNTAVDWAIANMSAAAACDFADSLARACVASVMDCIKAGVNASCIPDIIGNIKSVTTAIHSTIGCMMDAVAHAKVCLSAIDVKGFADKLAHEFISSILGCLKISTSSFFSNLIKEIKNIESCVAEWLKLFCHCGDDDDDDDDDKKCDCDECEGNCNCDPCTCGKGEEPGEDKCECAKCGVCGGCMSTECCGEEDCDCTPCECTECGCDTCEECGGCITEGCCGYIDCDCTPCECGGDTSCECEICEVCGGCLETECCGDCDCTPCTCVDDDKKCDCNPCICVGECTCEGCTCVGDEICECDKCEVCGGCIEDDCCDIDDCGCLCYTCTCDGDGDDDGDGGGDNGNPNYYPPYRGNTNPDDELDIFDEDPPLAGDWILMWLEGKGIVCYDTSDETVYVPYCYEIDGKMFFFGYPYIDYYLEENPKDFTDVGGHWAIDFIDFITQREVYLGYPDGSFRPDSSMTRAMFVTVLARSVLADLFLYGYEVFDDVDPTAYYGPAVAWAFDNGIVLGVGEGRFNPDGNITRQEMVLMIARYLDCEYITLKVKDGNAPFADEDDIDDWAAEAVELMRKFQIVEGKPGGLFDPLGVSTRAEVATVLFRLIESAITEAYEQLDEEGIEAARFIPFSERAVDDETAA
ncbi:MAG: S-layer homology domain-containing protein [Oscillospiraceae bacterium]|nr:S-layer homology domain-containing protein [Oscillospiraceae bacterium]